MRKFSTKTPGVWLGLSLLPRSLHCVLSFPRPRGVLYILITTTEAASGLLFKTRLSAWGFSVSALKSQNVHFQVIAHDIESQHGLIVK